MEVQGSAEEESSKKALKLEAWAEQVMFIKKNLAKGKT
jgi:hypothetical protein